MRSAVHVRSLVTAWAMVCSGALAIASTQTAAKPQTEAKPETAKKPRTETKPGTDASPPTDVKPRTVAPRRESRPEKQQPPADPPRASQAVYLTEEMQLRIDAAQAAKARGGYQDAIATYELAYQDAQADPNTLAHVSIAYAQTLESWVASTGAAPDPEGQERLRQAAELYRSALAAGTPAQRQLASNNLGTLLIRQRRYSEALQAFQQLDLESDPDRRFLYEYNLGRALEGTERRAEAFQRYLTSVEARPSFVPAHEAALQLVVAERPLNVDRAVKLGDTLVVGGQPAAGAAAMRASLQAGGGELTAERLLRVLMRAWVAMSIDLESFAAEARFLEGLSERGRVKLYADEIRRAVLDPDLPIVAEAWQGEQLFPAWTDNDATELALLLKHAADLYNRAGEHRRALARYGAAWAIDRGNGEAAVYAAMLLQDHAELDPDRRALNLLLEDVSAARSAARSRRDWPNSLRLHFVLGSIFERLGRWGPETDPRTAVYQWQAALDAEQRALKENPAFSRSPGLYLKLGEAYLHLAPPKPRLAREQFGKAAQAFEESGRTQEAADARRRLSTIGAQ